MHHPAPLPPTIHAPVTIPVPAPVPVPRPALAPAVLPVSPAPGVRLPLPGVRPAPATSQCQPLEGGGSYTCISFGAPHKPIFAFHTVQDQDGFFFGSGSGFDKENAQLLAGQENNDINTINSIETVRRARKVRVQKEFLAKLNKLRNRTSRTTFDFNSQKKKRMVTFPTINGLPITAYQQRLMSKADGPPRVQRYEYPL